MTEYISKKINKEDNPILQYVQIHYQLEKGERVTEAEVIGYALRHVAEEQFQYREKKARYTWDDIAGSIKGGKKSTEKEIDKIVYGV